MDGRDTPSVADQNACSPVGIDHNGGFGSPHGQQKKKSGENNLREVGSVHSDFLANSLPRCLPKRISMITISPLDINRCSVAFFATTLFLLFASPTGLHAQAVPELPAPSVGLFATPEDTAVTFDVQAAHGGGSMSYWRCEAVISSNGTVTGNATIFGFTGKSIKSEAQTVPFSGNLSNPRRSWTGKQMAIAGGAGLQLAADYTADFVARTAKPHNHSLKGLLILRYLVDYEPVGNGQLVQTNDLSRREAVITIFNARGPVGSVVRFDHPYSAWDMIETDFGTPTNNPPAPDPTPF